MDIVIATSNLHKIREIRALLKPIGKYDVFSISDFIHYKAPEETGTTFEENAILKAKSSWNSLKKMIIADDSGLVVPALNGAPGLFSARYAGENATDKENRKKLLEQMKDLSDIERSAYFECCIAFCDQKGEIKVFKGRCEGTIAYHERGCHGFGYDPIFIKNDYSLTFGEIDETIKNKVSARSKALSKLLIHL